MESSFGLCLGRTRMVSARETFLDPLDEGIVNIIGFAGAAPTPAPASATSLTDALYNGGGEGGRLPRRAVRFRAGGAWLPSPTFSKTTIRSSADRLTIFGQLSSDSFYRQDHPQEMVVTFHINQPIEQSSRQALRSLHMASKCKPTSSSRPRRP